VSADINRDTLWIHGKKADVLMITNARITAEEFASRKHELPEAGRWHELHEGFTVMLEPPDDGHGNAVLNLSRALAKWFQERPDQKVGYACHEIGLHVSSEPDTIYCPAISYFVTGQQFAETDKIMASTIPKLVVDIASSNDRRSEMRRRTQSYLRMGVETVWVPDPVKREVQVISIGEHTLALGHWQELHGAATLPDFSIAVEHVFAQPDWWR